jgi:L-ascorbate metabolism protein UlaG (beta-lactamase superfamily)
MSLKITGKLPSGKYLERLKKSPHFKSNGFENLSLTPMKPEGVSYWKMIKEFLKKNKDAKPSQTIPSVKTNLNDPGSEHPTIIWFGHSSYLIKIEGKNILVDPVFSGNAAPLSFMVKAFAGSDAYKTEDMPAIDYLILTHDHYDHLDFKTIRKLKSRIGQVYCSLGLGSHLKYWGIPETKIHEMDWWESNSLDEHISLTAAPARHFSGRGLKRFQTLWSSFILKTRTHTIFIGGDSGYDKHFKEIGDRFGPFDIAILESGQYNSMWPLIHMMPEETVMAAADLKAKVLLPVHWGKFSLALHAWNEPIQRVLDKAQALKVQVTSPRIGEPVILGERYPNERWWEFENRIPKR